MCYFCMAVSNRSCESCPSISASKLCFCSCEVWCSSKIPQHSVTYASDCPRAQHTVLFREPHSLVSLRPSLQERQITSYLLPAVFLGAMWEAQRWTLASCQGMGASKWFPDELDGFLQNAKYAHRLLWCLVWIQPCTNLWLFALLNINKEVGVGVQASCQLAPLPALLLAFYYTAFHSACTCREEAVIALI